MGWVIAGIVFFIPLAFLPRLFFYYDVTPKAAAAMLGAAILLAYAAWKPKTAVSFMTSRFGRWNAAAAAAYLLVTMVSAAVSPVVSLAWSGSNWRRFGAVEQIATVACAFLLASVARSSTGNLLAVLRALCGAGVVAGLYGIAQYFGYDPFIPTATYLVGEGRYQIVRPPGPLGHSDYFAAFLLGPIFAGAALSRVDVRRAGRWLGVAAVLTGVVAVVLAGSRGAFLGLLAGAVILAWHRRPRLETVAASLAIFGTIAMLFYISPAGARLRARAFWISEDAGGGARLLLWRDSFSMSSSRLAAGFGPDTFVAQFPQFQSAELGRAYPDFYHESPHNMFLDALNGQGVIAVFLLIGWIIVASLAALRAPPSMRSVAWPLLAGLIATIVAQQFVVLVVPTAFLFFLTLGLLAGLEPGGRGTVPVPLRVAVAGGCAAAAIVVALAASRLVSADLALARVKQALDGDRSKAAALWESAGARRSAGVTADLYFSRRWAEAASSARDPGEQARMASLAVQAALLATTVPEQRQNAWYNFAILAAARNNLPAVESSLRSAIAAGPRWFKPHWTLARLLYSEGRVEEARQEAMLAIDLDGGKNPEVAVTTAEIVRSLDSRR